MRIALRYRSALCGLPKASPVPSSRFVLDTCRIRVVAFVAARPSLRRYAR